MMLESVAIRRALPEDAAALSAYMHVLADENLPQLSGLRPSPEEERSFLKKTLESAGAFVLIAETQGAIVGMVDVWPGKSAFDKHVAKLGMSVLAPHRRKGIGRQLLNSAVMEAKNLEGICRIELDVVPWNEPAIRLYETAGFLREGVKRKAAVFRGKFNDLLLMAMVW